MHSLKIIFYKQRQPELYKYLSKDSLLINRKALVRPISSVSQIGQALFSKSSGARFELLGLGWAKYFCSRVCRFLM